MSEFRFAARGIRVVYRRGGAFGAPGSDLTALADVDLEIRRGETVAVVGESGCGKSTLARALVLLTPPDAGTIEIDGRVVFDASARRRPSRAATIELRRRVQIVFQDPITALNPRMSAGRAVAEGILVHGLARGAAARARAGAALELVGLSPEIADRLPHELSGGQRQRVSIARALAVEPELLILDEPTSALDVSVQAKIIELLEDLRGRLGLALVFVSHDLGLVRRLADRVTVLRGGCVVETASAADLYESPRHPYTRTLLEAAGGSSAWVEEGAAPRGAADPE